MPPVRLSDDELNASASVMAITKCLISTQTVIRVTVAARALRQRSRTRPGDWMVRAGLVEKIMSKTTDTSYDVAATSERELTEAELELVNGAWLKWLENQEQLRAAETFKSLLQKAAQV